MKTMCPPGYHHNGFVVTHAFGGHIIFMVTIMVLWQLVQLGSPKRDCAQVHQFP